jgi:hypothetical protein
MVQLILVIAFVAGEIWFYQHCARPSLQWAGARRSAYTLGFMASVVSCCAFVGSFEASEILHGTSAWIRPLLAIATVAGAVDALAWARPEWIVQLTGGPDPIVLAARRASAPVSDRFGPVVRRVDVRRFASRWWIIAAAALAAQLSGELGLALVRLATGAIGGTSGHVVPVIEPYVVVLFGVIPGTIILSRGFSGRLFERPEAVAVGFTLLWSSVGGSIALSIADPVLRVFFGSAWVHAQARNQVIQAPFEALASAAILVPIEFFVWVNYASTRTKAAWRRLWRLTDGWQSDDPAAIAGVRGALVHLRRSRTAETWGLSTAVEGLARMWLGDPVHPDDDAQALAEAINREATVLFGPPIRGQT